MNKIKLIGMVLGWVTFLLNGMEEQSINKLTFTLAQEGEDLSIYEKIVIDAFMKHFKTDEEKETITKSLQRQFKLLVSWIGQKDKRFIKIHKQDEPYGFLTLQSLSDDDTRITFNLSVVKDPKVMDQYIACVREQFPRIRTLYTYGRNQSLQDHQRALGFVIDESYVPNKELIPDPTGFKGFRIDFKE